MRAGDHDGAFEEAGFLDPVRARQFAVAVEAEDAREYGVLQRHPPARQNCGDARAHSMLAGAFDECRVADCDRRNVGNCVERSGSAVERNAEPAGARVFGRKGGAEARAEHDRDG